MHKNQSEVPPLDKYTSKKNLFKSNSLKGVGKHFKTLIGYDCRDDLYNSDTFKLHVENSTHKKHEMGQQL